jgi:hypothetical protein
MIFGCENCFLDAVQQWLSRPSINHPLLDLGGDDDARHTRPLPRRKPLSGISALFDDICLERSKSVLVGESVVHDQTPHPADEVQLPIKTGLTRFGESVPADCDGPDGARLSLSIAA